jgi:hypothetical protein
MATADLTVLALGRASASATDYTVPFEQGAPRVYTVLKLDERRDRPGQTLDDKVRAVEDRLGGGDI